MVTKSKFTTVQPQPIKASKPRAAKTRMAEAVTVDADHGGDPFNPIHPAHSAQPESSDTLFTRMRDSAEAYFASMNEPTWKRRTVSLLLGVLAYGGVFYGAMQIVDAMCLAAVLYAGVGFISFMVALIGIILSMVAAVSVFSRVYNFAMKFDIVNVKNSVTSLFARNNSVETNHA